MTFGFGFGFPRRVGAGGSSFSPASLFAAGEVGAWYDPSDLTTLFQDTAGTTPITTPGQTVALMLDKSRGGIGSELVTNGNFSNGATGWTLANATVSGGVLNVTSGSRFVAQNSGLVTGQLYYVSYNWTANAGTGVGSGLRVNTGATNGQQSALEISFGGGSNLSGTVSGFVTAIGPFIAIEAANFPFNGTIDNISVRAAPGNHATQATTASRPTYGIVPATGRRNLLLWTEDFTNAVWTKTNITLTSGIVDPNGGTAAFTFTASAANGTVSRSVGSLAAGSAISFWIRRRTGTGAVAMWDGNSYNDVTVTGSWARVQINQDILTTGFWDMRLAVSGDAVDVAFPQVETGSTATAYQRVTTQWDVTEAGVQSLSYLGFDGVDDFMLTGTITPGSVDKMQLFAGVRRLSASLGIVVEYSVNWTTNAGSFSLNSSYEMGSRGTVSAFCIGSSFSIPVNQVVTGTGDISGDRVALRVNGTQIVQSTADQGSGNFLAYPLYIGRRAGLSFPLNYNFYGMITRFSAANLDADTITSTETWLNGKTGAY